jgi:hypothetical protein
VTDACIVESTLRDGLAVGCMLGTFGTIQFPPADGFVTVVYPIMYSPDSEN